MARSRAAYEYTEAEDKSMRLGFLLIAAGLLSLLGLGCCWLRPALQERGGGGSANCTVLAVRQLGERFACTFSCGAACRGTARYPCLQVLVRTSRSSAPALLHEDERQLRTNPKCSYIPPCARDDQENSENVTYKQKYWKEKVGSQPFTCYFNQHLSVDVAAMHMRVMCGFLPSVNRKGRESFFLSLMVICQEIKGNVAAGGGDIDIYDKNKKKRETKIAMRPDDVMLKRTHDETVLLHCFLWPVVTFLVGVLIVVLTICAKSLAIRAEAIKKKKHL
ncbi:Calcium-activated potassium channel subunit beta-4 [Lonchura striata]|uniref:Calcium-activated potassium channel subunit beta-4 n=1 Tax=Lonchura striata TaxID=40157 RepID=A0A218UQR2_9PASE|nr:Calcium-activated potassium channel subunit beta-4 [Lonchura striata domestica]